MPLRKKSDLEIEVISGMTILRENKQNGRLYVSNTSYCNKQGVLAANDTDSFYQEPQTTGYFATGLAIENIVLDSLYSRNRLLFSQLDIPDIGLNLGGRIDGIIKLEDKPIQIIEIKSCGSTLPSKPSVEHEAQARLYSAILGFPSRLFYMSRNIADSEKNVLVRSFDLDYNWLERFQSVYDVCFAYVCNMAKVTPNIPTFIDSVKHCGFCKYKDICWNGKENPLREFESLSAAEQSNIVEKATDLAEDLMSSESVESRRNGILKHISKYGTVFAKTLLEKQDWSKLLLTEE